MWVGWVCGWGWGVGGGGGMGVGGWRVEINHAYTSSLDGWVGCTMYVRTFTLIHKAYSISLLLHVVNSCDLRPLCPLDHPDLFLIFCPHYFSSPSFF